MRNACNTRQELAVVGVAHVGGATGVGTENIHFPSARTKHNTDGLAHSGSSEMAPFEDSRQAPVCFPK